MEQVKDNLWKLNQHHYLKKRRNKFSIIAPIKDPITKKMDFFNLFVGLGWGNLLKVAIILVFILGISWSYAHDTRECRELMENYNQETGCIDQDYFNIKRGLYDESIKINLSLFGNPEINVETLNT